MRRIDRVAEWLAGAATEVHRCLGPGLLESAYEEALQAELDRRRIKYRRQVPVQVFYKGRALKTNYRLDLLIEECLVIEIKAITALKDIHRSQLLTYLRTGGKPMGLMINFNADPLEIIRMTNEPDKHTAARARPRWQRR